MRFFFSNIVKLDSELIKLYQLPLSDAIEFIGKDNLIVESEDNVSMRLYLLRHFCNYHRYVYYF